MGNKYNGDCRKSVLFSGDMNLKGKVGRIIEINISPEELFDDAEQAEEIQRLYQSCYRVIEPIFVTYLLKNGIVITSICIEMSMIRSVHFLMYTEI